jgi:hypothetical protein
MHGHQQHRTYYIHSSDVICFGTLFWNGKKLQQSVSKVEVIVQQPRGLMNCSAHKKEKLADLDHGPHGGT